MKSTTLRPLTTTAHSSPFGRRRLRRLGGLAIVLLATMSMVAASCGNDGDGDAADVADTGDASVADGSAAGDPDGSADAGDADGSVPEDSDDDEAPSGGSLTVLIESDPFRLDPVELPSILVSSNQSVIAAAIFDTLLVQSTAPEINGETLSLAESITTEDGLTWTLTLRPGLEFSDGTPLDAEAVRYNFARHADPENPSPAQSIASTIAEMAIESDTALRITLDAPNTQFADSVAESPMTYVGSPTAIEALGETFGNEPVGAGPFVVEEWVRDSRMTLSRNDAYWDAPKPALDEVVFEIVPDDSQRLSTFLTADDAHLTLSATKLQADEALAAGAQVLTVAPGGGNVIVFNMTKPPFDSLTARLALVRALDFEQYSEVVLQGDAAPKSHLFDESSPHFHDSLAFPSYDADIAAELFDEYASEAGGPLEFSLLCASSFRSTCEFFQAQLQAYENVDMQIDLIDRTQVVPRQRTGEFEASLGAVGALIDPHVAAQLSSGGIRNVGGYANPAVDQAFETGRTAVAVEDQTGAYRIVQEALIEDLPYAYISTRSLEHLIATDDVSGLADYTGGNIPRWADISLRP